MTQAKDKEKLADNEQIPSELPQKYEKKEKFNGAQEAPVKRMKGARQGLISGSGLTVSRRILINY